MRFHDSTHRPVHGKLISIGVRLPKGWRRISLQSGFQICRSYGDRSRRCRVLDVEVDCNPTIGCPISSLNFFFVDLDGVGPRRQLAELAIQSERMLEAYAG